MRTLRLTSPLMTGNDVRSVQKLLEQNVFKTDWLPGPKDAGFGPITAGACRACKWQIGYAGSSCQPIAGDLLVSFLDGSKKPTLVMKWRAKVRKPKPQPARDRMLELAKGEVGVKEEPAGSNDGPRIRGYQAVTKAFQAPWCASFQCWLLRRAGYGGPLPPLPAYCPSWVSMAHDGKAGWRVMSTDNARPGDQVVYRIDGRAGHIGVLTTRVGGGNFKAIEGNTSTGSDSNGGEVMERSRSTDMVVCFIRVPL